MAYAFEQVEGLKPGSVRVLKVRVGGKCPLDDFYEAQRLAGGAKNLVTLQTLLDNLAQGKRLPNNKMTLLSSGRGTGKRVHPGEFELRIKSLRVYGFLHEGIACILCLAEGKQGKGKSLNQTETIIEMREMIPHLLKPLDGFLSG